MLREEGKTDRTDTNSENMDQLKCGMDQLKDKDKKSDRLRLFLTSLTFWYSVDQAERDLCFLMEGFDNCEQWGIMD